MKYIKNYPSLINFETDQSLLTPYVVYVDDINTIFVRDNDNIVYMTFTLEDSDTVFIDYSNFKTFNVDGKDLFEETNTYELINSKNNISSSINFITDYVSDVILKTNRAITENDYFAIISYNSESYYIALSHAFSGLASDVVKKIDDFTYQIDARIIIDSMLNEGNVALLFIEDVNNIYTDLEESTYENWNPIEDFNIILNNIDGIVETKMKCTSMIHFPSNNGTYTVEATLKNNVKFLNKATFGNCLELNSIILPKCINKLQDYTFNVCLNLTEIILSDNIIEIGKEAISSCINLTNIIIPNKVKSIRENAFLSCYGLTNIEIPNSVYYLDMHVFQECSNLKTITFGNSVKSLGDNIFNFCSSLDTITSLSITAPTICENTFRDVNSNGVLKVPSGSDYNSWLNVLPSGWTIEYF